MNVVHALYMLLVAAFLTMVALDPWNEAQCFYQLFHGTGVSCEGRL